jgi:uncharacterized protein (TIGR03435 family)
MGHWQGMNMTIDATGISLEDFSRVLDNMFHRPVVDKTGIAGSYDFHLEFAVDPTIGMPLPPPPLGGDPGAAPPEPAVGPSIFTALQELGLKIDSAKGPGEFIVIDSVDRPSEN